MGDLLAGELGLSVTMPTPGDKVCVVASGMLELEPSGNSPGPLLVTSRASVAWRSMRCLPFRSPDLTFRLAPGAVSVKFSVASPAVVTPELRGVVELHPLLVPGLPRGMGAVSADSINDSMGPAPVRNELLYSPGAEGPLPPLEDWVVRWNLTVPTNAIFIMFVVQPELLSQTFEGVLEAALSLRVHTARHGSPSAAEYSFLCSLMAQDIGPTEHLLYDPRSREHSISRVGAMASRRRQVRLGMTPGPWESRDDLPANCTSGNEVGRREQA